MIPTWVQKRAGIGDTCQLELDGRGRALIPYGMINTHRQVHRGVDGLLGHRGNHVESDVREEDAGNSPEDSIHTKRSKRGVIGLVDLDGKV